MPGEEQRIGSGMSSREMRERSTSVSLRPGGTAMRPAPMQSRPVLDALRTKEEAIAGSVLDSTQAQLETERIEAETRRLEATIKREELMAARGGGGTNALMQWLMEQQQTTQATIEQLREANQQAMLQSYEMRMGMLAERLESLQGMLAQPAPPQMSGLEMLEEEIGRAQRITQLVSGGQTAARNNDAELLHEGYKLRLQAEQETKRLQIERETALRERELSFEERKWQEEMALKKHQLTTMERGWTNGVPQLAAIVQQVLERFTPATATATPQVAAQVAGPAAPAPTPLPASIPPGMEAQPCNACGATMVFNPAWGQVVCQHCYTSYTWDPEEAAGEDAAPPAPAAPSMYKCGCGNIGTAEQMEAHRALHLEPACEDEVEVA